MRLLTDQLPPHVRSAIRFIIVGTTCTVIHLGIYHLCLKWFGLSEDSDSLLVYVAFAIGFAVEMVINYFVTAYYVFSSRPNTKNALGYLAARALNFGVQNFFLWLLLLVDVNTKHAGLVAIVLAGIVNFFVQKVFFKHLKNK